MKLNTSKRRGGFTLVELLLVLVILGVLAAIVIPKFSGRTEQAKEQATRTQISTFRTAISAYEIDNGSFPRSLQDLVTQPREAQNWRGPYIDAPQVPTDPWGNAYVYEVPGKVNASSYDVYSQGPPGQSKVIGNWNPTQQR